MSAKLSRRGFLVASGITATFLVGCSSIPAIPKRPAPTAEAAMGWITLLPSGQWRLFSPRMEMGQNILSSLREVAALELGVDAAHIQVQLPSTKDIALVKATVGSDSLRELCLPLARACHALRVELMRRAALRLPNASADKLQIQDDAVQDGAGARVSLSELALPALAIEAKDTPVEQLRFFKTPLSQARSSKPFAQTEAIARGQALYASDVRLPGMLYAIVLRSPWADRELAPSSLASWNEAAVRAVPGFHTIVQHPSLAGPALVAKRMSAVELMRSAADAKWIEPASATADPMKIVDVDKTLASGSFTKSKGSVEQGTWAVDMRLDVPLASHAFIEPRCAVAQPQEGGGMKLWCGTQDVFYVRDVVRRDLNVAAEKVEVQAMRIGGGFGGKTIASVEREAALIAKAVGQAVKVQWSRADEFQAGFHRQPASQRIRARLDAQGMISDWQHSLSTSHVLFTNAVAPPWMQRITNSFIGDDGAARGQAPVYGFKRQRLDIQLTRLPVLTGPWRGLGAGPNVLAIEMAMDAAALAAKKDPVDFRLAHLKASAADNPAGDAMRIAQCLEKAVRLSKNKPIAVIESARAAPENIARRIVTQGVACGAYKAMAYAAAVAEVEVVLGAGNKLRSIRVRKIWCTHDCGRMIDAQGVLAQVQGNLVWTIGMVLTEQLNAPRGTAEALNFSSYSIPRLTDTPPMEIELIESNASPTGAGETAMVAGAGAIANAVVRALREAGLPVPQSVPFKISA
ncbi:molybdopterin cofactor-binding domain-containing protein [Variovorax sp. PCZ-1]|uniref:xanthine dehydrogenase family protein molybdopterin-binding subunit n=1 Tax=Variovorax sp. PCZ-1 TaxID=2835533 RepID=UPI001BD0F132|nr:molybdopterin cofactor-binding domain-containing protein [Variovorax sp. PCZ-1]MBS7807200.1 xanthine dehydrogenase family protein molybdopterin-binding subunit [Variovorax sp. PCZ-1]